MSDEQAQQSPGGLKQQSQHTARKPKPIAGEHSAAAGPTVAGSQGQAPADAGTPKAQGQQPVHLGKQAPAAGAVGSSKGGVSRTGSIKRHGSTTSRRLQALLASEELSSLSLGTEGSDLPGGTTNTHAKQLHAVLLTPPALSEPEHSACIGPATHQICV